MMVGKVRGMTCGFVLGAFMMPVLARGQGSFVGPVELRVDNLTTPLGIDDPAPRFSWQLQDPSRGARQTAYEVVVASRQEFLQAGKADIWDSGHIKSDQSLNVRYGGPALQPGTRYFWRVKVLGDADKVYPESEFAWWETGLLNQEAWKATWIGFETPEESAVRHAPALWINYPGAKQFVGKKGDEQRYAYRVQVELKKPVRSAALYATGEDTVSAWVNGVQVLSANAYPSWKHLPWKKFVRAEVSGNVKPGTNTIAIESVHYVDDSDGPIVPHAPAMIATLVVEYIDGTTATFASDTSWKSAMHPADGWQQTGFDDSAWKPAAEWKQEPGPRSQPQGHPWMPDSVKALRHEFEPKGPVKSARLYSTALGAYEMFLNGKRVSEDVMAPGWTDYREHVTYETYDVTSQVKSGKNAIGALLAPGWYSTPLEWLQQANNYGDSPPALRAQLRIEHTDGGVEWVCTGPDWRASTSYILHSELYDGEVQDARRIEPGWSEAGFPADRWASAITIEPSPVAIEAQYFPPIRVERTISAKTMTEPKPGVYVYDFGQNLAGVERLRVEGLRGTDVRVRFAEVLNGDGTLYTDNLRTAQATDHFLLAGNGLEEFTPQFTFHGFRYAEVTGLPKAPDKDAVAANAIHTDATFSVKLTTGNEMINKLWSNILWGQRSNFIGLPTDCPQRDERLGWMADAQVFWRTATYNMDLAAFSRKFAGDMRGTQAGTPFFGIYAPGTAQRSSGPAAGWSDAGAIIPWTSWLQTGDTSVIDENWEAMEEYLGSIDAANSDGIWKHHSGIPFGDWLSLEGRTQEDFVATAFWAYDVTLMREMAHATGRTEAEQRYAQLFEKIRAAFQKRFLHDGGFLDSADNSPSPFGEINNPNAKSVGGDTQTAYVLALHMNLLPDDVRAAAASRLVGKIERNNGLLGTGFLGTPYLLEELTKSGNAKLAYSLLLNTGYPSWGYLVEHGATTTWERWNGDQMRDDPKMNSYNHYAYGAVADWIYRYAAGVDATPLDAGFHTIVLHPNFDARLGSLDFSYASSYGLIRSTWAVRGQTAEWNLTIPANATGRLDLGASEAAQYKLEGVPLPTSKLIRASNGGFELPAGSYRFVVALTEAPDSK